MRKKHVRFLSKTTALLLTAAVMLTSVGTVPAKADDLAHAEFELSNLIWNEKEVVKTAYADAHTKKHYLHVWLDPVPQDGGYYIDIKQGDKIIKQGGKNLKKGSKTRLIYDLTPALYRGAYQDGDELTVIFTLRKGDGTYNECARTSIVGLGLLQLPSLAVPEVQSIDERATNAIVRHYRPAAGRTIDDVSALYAKSSGFGFLPPVTQYETIGDRDGMVLPLTPNGNEHTATLGAEQMDALQHGDVVSAYISDGNGRFSKAVSQLIDKTPINVAQDGDLITATVPYGSSGTITLVGADNAPVMADGRPLSGSIESDDSGHAIARIILPAEQRAALDGQNVRVMLSERSDNAVASEAIILHTVAQKGALETCLTAAQQIKASERFTYAQPAAKDAFLAALAAAENLQLNPNAGQADVDAAANALQQAMNALDGKKPAAPVRPTTPAHPKNDRIDNSGDYSNRSQKAQGKTAASEQKKNPDRAIKETPTEPAQAPENVDAPYAWRLLAPNTPYLYGYEDGQFHPENAMTRAEIAAMVSRLIIMKETQTQESVPFSDVHPDDWFAGAVAKLCQAQVLSGYEDHTFRPHAAITRAEFAALLSRLQPAQENEVAPHRFNDVGHDHWAHKAICQSAAAGWMRGTGDAAFAPERILTRAEAAAILNRLTKREEVNDNKEAWRQFSDVPQDHWAYNDILLAANPVVTRQNTQKE